MAAVLFLLCAGCSSGGSDDSSGAAATSPAEASSTSSAGASGASASSTAAADIPGSCPAILPTIELDKAIGVQLPGTPIYAVGEPQPEIKRLWRVTCSYGIVSPATGPPPVQVSAFAYATAADAKARIDKAISDNRDIGLPTKDVKLGELTGTVLGSLTEPTLVVAKGEFTYSATIQATLLPAPAQEPALIAIVNAMLAAA